MTAFWVGGEGHEVFVMNRGVDAFTSRMLLGYSAAKWPR